MSRLSFCSTTYSKHLQNSKLDYHHIKSTQINCILKVSVNNIYVNFTICLIHAIWIVTFKFICVNEIFSQNFFRRAFKAKRFKLTIDRNEILAISYFQSNRDNMNVQKNHLCQNTCINIHNYK